MGVLLGCFDLDLLVIYAIDLLFAFQRRRPVSFSLIQPSAAVILGKLVLEHPRVYSRVLLDLVTSWL